MSEIRNVSLALQTIAQEIDVRLADIAGRRVGFSLVVYTDGRLQYVSNSTDRAEIAAVLRKLLAGWEKGMPNVPAHEIQG